MWDRSPVTRRQEAEYIAEQALEKGLVTFGKHDPLFADYILGFWDFGNSDYIKRRNRKNPNSIGKDYANNMRSVFENHAMPFLLVNLRLSGVTTEHIEHVVNELLDKGDLSNATIRRVLQAMSVPLKEARRLQLIPANPMDNVEPLAIHPKQRGIVTASELSRMIRWMRMRTKAGTFDGRVLLATELSAVTGMRQGEIRALASSSIRLATGEEGIITVSRSIAEYAGLKTTKGKRDRHVPRPGSLCTALLACARKNPYANGLVFWSDASSAHPLSASFIRDQFYRALEGIGIAEEERERRNLTFHSLRHYYVTYMRGKVGDRTLQSIVGHRSTEMTDHYTHETEERLLEVGKVSARILQFPTQETA